MIRTDIFWLLFGLFLFGVAVLNCVSPRGPFGTTYLTVTDPIEGTITTKLISLEDGGTP